MTNTAQIDQKLFNIFSKCTIRLENEELSREHLLKTYIAFLDDNMFCDKHKTISVLGADNKCFDAITIACAAMSCVLSDDINPESIVSHLEIGAKVEYKKSRYIYKGLNEKFGPERIELVKDNGEHVYIGKSSWNKIVPYYGKAESLDGRGIRRQSPLRELFYTNVLEKTVAEIPSILKTSVIMIMSPDEARYYLENISFSFGKNTIPLLDLITASYYTENNAFRFRGNSADNDPVLKITNRAEKARSLMFDNTENETLGVIVIGQDVYHKNYTELPSLVSRRKLQYSLLSMRIDNAYGYDVLNQYEAAELFACTKDFLLSVPLEIVSENQFTSRLFKTIDHIVDHETKKIIVDSEFSAKDYYGFKSLMSSICHQAKDNRNDKDDLFIRQAYSLMRLFASAPFEMESLDRGSDQQVITVPSAREKLESIKVLISEISPFLSEQADKVLNILERAYECFLKKSGKETFLKELLKSNRERKIAIVVPYEYYISIMKQKGVFRCMKHASSLSISTPAGFDNQKDYDIIITTALLSEKSFDVFRSRVAYMTYVLIYSFEDRLFKSKEHFMKQNERLLNERLSFDIEPDELFSDEESSDALETLNNDDLFVEDFINKLNAAVFYYSSPLADGRSLGAASNKTVTVRSAIFENEEVAFFTKNYKAYVLNTIEETVIEKSVDTLSVGDTLIFTRSNENTRDIVEIILQRIVENEKVSEDIKLSYHRSIRWKEDLQHYKQQNGLSNTEVVEALIREGVEVGEMAIRTWLDPDSHTVKPRAKSSLLAIAKVTKDAELENQIDMYIAACDDIYRLRRTILKEIGQAIIGQIAGKAPEAGTYLAEIYERLDSAAQILRIESISERQQEVPLNYTNRPFFQ